MSRLCLPTTINTGDNEGGAVLNSKGSQIFFTRCPREKKENIGCDIFFAEKQGSSWKNASMIVLKPEGGDSLSCGHPTLDKSRGVYWCLLLICLVVKVGKDLWYIEYNKREKAWGATG